MPGETFEHKIKMVIEPDTTPVIKAMSELQSRLDDIVKRAADTIKSSETSAASSPPSSAARPAATTPAPPSGSGTTAPRPTAPSGRPSLASGAAFAAGAGAAALTGRQMAQSFVDVLRGRTSPLAHIADALRSTRGARLISGSLFERRPPGMATRLNQIIERRMERMTAGQYNPRSMASFRDYLARRGLRGKAAELSASLPRQFTFRHVDNHGRFQTWTGPGTSRTAVEAWGRSRFRMAGKAYETAQSLRARQLPGKAVSTVARDFLGKAVGGVGPAGGAVLGGAIAASGIAMMIGAAAKAAGQFVEGVRQFGEVAQMFAGAISKADPVQLILGGNKAREALARMNVWKYTAAGAVAGGAAGATAGGLGAGPAGAAVFGSLGTGVGAIGGLITGSIKVWIVKLQNKIQEMIFSAVDGLMHSLENYNSVIFGLTRMFELRQHMFMFQLGHAATGLATAWFQLKTAALSFLSAILKAGVLRPIFDALIQYLNQIKAQLPQIIGGAFQALGQIVMAMSTLIDVLKDFASAIGTAATALAAFANGLVGGATGSGTSPGTPGAPPAPSTAAKVGGVAGTIVGRAAKAAVPQLLVIDAIKDAWHWITGRAAGGPVDSGKSYVVGENGPELFVPKQPGQIVPMGAATQPANKPVLGSNQAITGLDPIRVAGQALIDIGKKIASMKAPDGSEAAEPMWQAWTKMFSVRAFPLGGDYHGRPQAGYPGTAPGYLGATQTGSAAAAQAQRAAAGQSAAHGASTAAAAQAAAQVRKAPLAVAPQFHQNIQLNFKAKLWHERAIYDGLSQVREHLLKEMDTVRQEARLSISLLDARMQAMTL